jgi:hypothetical protein
MIVVQITDSLREVVVQEASNRVKRSQKTLSSAYPEQDLQQQSRFRRPALAGIVRAVQAMVMWNTAEQRGRRERSPQQEYLIVNGQSEGRRGRGFI